VPSLRRYIPPLCPDPHPETVTFDNQEDLLVITWVNQWTGMKGFDRFTHGETPGGDPLLIAKFKHGSVVVIGFLDARLPWIA